MNKINYRLYCEPCGWKKDISDEEHIVDLYCVKPSAIQLEIPKLNNGKIVESKFKKQLKKIRCPNCGRLISPKKFNNEIKKN